MVCTSEILLLDSADGECLEQLHLKYTKLQNRGDHQNTSFLCVYLLLLFVSHFCISFPYMHIKKQHWFESKEVVKLYVISDLKHWICLHLDI